MAQKSEIDDRPATLAEGYPVATEVPNLPAGTVTEAPTDEDYKREWQTFRALTPLTVDGARAVAKGGPVPASHPMLDSWIADGLIERVDGQPIQTPQTVATGALPAGAAVVAPSQAKERDAS